MSQVLPGIFPRDAFKLHTSQWRVLQLSALLKMRQQVIRKVRIVPGYTSGKGGPLTFDLCTLALGSGLESYSWPTKPLGCFTPLVYLHTSPCTLHSNSQSPGVGPNCPPYSWHILTYNFSLVNLSCLLQAMFILDECQLGASLQARSRHWGRTVSKPEEASLLSGSPHSIASGGGQREKGADNNYVNK